MISLRRILHEPLLHFLLLGGLVFGAFALISDAEPDTGDVKSVRITGSQAGQIVDSFRDTWRRPPTRDELDNMLEALVREDILVQEAMAISMDVDDTVIRRRLAQKMEFLISSSAGAQMPSEDDLQAFFQERAENYASAPSIAFEQVFLGAGPDPDSVSGALDALVAGRAPEEIGRATLLPQQFGPAARNPVDGVYGSGFFERVMAVEPGDWAGPVASGFGVHLVRVTDRDPGAVPDFDDVREEVEADWRKIETDRLSERIMQELRADYEVILPDAETLQALTQ